MSSIFYRKLGKGYPIILIHGFCETHEIWNGFDEKLSEQFEVYSIDLPGFGESPILPSPFSIEDVGTKVVEWIEGLDRKHPIIIGHSLGGYVALAIAKKFQEKIAGIGLFQSTAYPDSEDRKANRNKVIQFVKNHGPDPFIDTFVPGLFFDKKHPSISEVYKVARKTSKEALMAYAGAMRDRPSSIDLNRYFQKPVLVLGGERDVIISEETTLEHGNLFTGSEVHILKNVGHMAMFESHEESLKIVEEFALKTIANH
jgi:pimeloyl-ACP methyl ester carboxylesterase